MSGMCEFCLHPNSTRHWIRETFARFSRQGTRTTDAARNWCVPTVAVSTLLAALRCIPIRPSQSSAVSRGDTPISAALTLAPSATTSAFLQHLLSIRNTVATRSPVNQTREPNMCVPALPCVSPPSCPRHPRLLHGCVPVGTSRSAAPRRRGHTTSNRRQ